MQDVFHLIRYNPHPSSRPQPSTPDPSNHQSIYRFATALTLPLLASLLLFWLFTSHDATSVQAWSLLPNSYLILLLLAFLLPSSLLHRLAHYIPRAGRTRLNTTFRRISYGGLASTDNGKFGDVLLADALTSFAKPLSEVYIALCMLFTGQKTTSRPDRDCGGTYIVPLIMCIPFLIRLRQCLSDGQRANALKYFTAFPAIALSAMQRDADTLGLSATTLFRLWLLAVMINSLYSFYWDVAQDWDLTLFSSSRSHPEQPYGLRRVRVFHPPELYYGVMAADLLLRCTWSMKLSVHLEHFNDIEGGIFLLEVLEIGRRWMWAFFRIEAEWIRGRQSGDVLLDELGGPGVKVDDD